MLGNRLRAQRPNVAHVFERCRRQLDRQEALSRISVGEQCLVIDRHRPEETRLGVAYGLQFAGLDLEAEQVRDAGVERTAKQETPVRGERKAFRKRVAEVELLLRLEVIGQHVFDGVDLEGVLAEDIANRRR